MSKYNNKKIIIDNIKFDSLLEADYYIFLKEMVDKKIVESFIIHPKFKICNGYYRSDKKYIRPVYCVLDFQVLYSNGNIEYIDTKGYATEISKLKRKLLESQFPNIRVKWIQKNNYYGDKYGWIEKEVLDNIIKNNKKNIKKIK